MTEYRLARPEEEAQILDFINMVFSQTYRPHHFDRLLPKVYAHPGFSAYHFVACQEGRIRATVAMTELTLNMRGAPPLKAGFLGSVSVHEKARGEGHMKQLMKRTLEEAAARDYDFLALGGQRQRYGYWGFEKGGARLEFSLGEANIRHALKDVAENAVTFREITDPADPALDEIAALGDRQPLSCPRPRPLLLDIMHSWENTLFALEDMKNGRAFLGYATTQGNQIVEMALTDEGRAPEVIKAWMRGKSSAVISVPPYLTERARLLKSFAEDYALGDAEMFKILNWPRVLAAALTFKRGYRPLPAGRFVFQVEGAGRFALSLQGAQIAAVPTTETPERVFTPCQAVEFFFSPYAALMEEDAPPRGWLPLPLEIPAAHAF